MAVRIVHLFAPGAVAVCLLMSMPPCAGSGAETVASQANAELAGATNAQLLKDLAAGRNAAATQNELISGLLPRDPRRAEIRAGLLRLLAERQDEEFILRAMPVVVVGLRGDPQAAKAVLSLYERLKKGPLRMVIINDLGYMRAVEAIPTLKTIVQTPPGPGPTEYDERPVALQALGQIGGAAVDFLLGCATGEVALERWLRDDALVGLAHIGDPRALPIMRAEVRSTNSGQRAVALMGMGTLAQKFPDYREEAARLACEALRDKSPNVREEGARVLGRIGTPDHLELLDALADSDPHVTKMMDKYRGEVDVYPVREAARGAILAIRRRFKLDDSAAE